MKKLSLVLALIFLVNFGCDDFLDVNLSEDSPTTSTPNFLLPAVISNTATSVFDHGDELAYVTQQLATFSGFDKYKDRWDYVTANRVKQWRRHYFDIGKNIFNTIEAAEREEATNYIGISKILFAFSTLRTTAMFGDMPFFEAITNNPSPKYDDQAVIYGEVLKLLEEGITLLENTNPATVWPLTAKEDNVYGGNLEHWIRFAYAVKARALLHYTPNINQNYADIIAAANTALNGWEDAAFDYSVGGGNPLQTNQFGESQARPEWDFAQNTYGTSAPTPFFLEEVLKYDSENHIIGDPRISYLMEPNSEGHFLSIMPSVGKVPTILNEDYPNLYGSYITRDNAPLYFFRAEELHFILAEAYFQSEDKPNAYQAFIEGITINMDRAGVPASERTDFLASEHIPQNANELLLRDIMMQKHVALWLEGEVWTDMRRYRWSNQIYLGLQQPPNLEFYWNDGEFLERFPYDTETEEIYNKPELDRLGAYQNPQWLKKPMIWAE